jgi:UDP-N-acetylmuramate--alanine ligase
MLGRTRRVHFVGIGGIGMSGIAELLANLGYTVTGSDLQLSVTTARLSRLGVAVEGRHDAANVGQADVVVFSSAVRPSNPEIAEARRRGIPVIPRAEMLAELMRLRFSIAVAGSHGKTTTTSMIALVLEHAGLDPTAVIGGRLSAFGSNARLGSGQYLVAEADESDRSFLMLWPSIVVLTNVDDEHLDSYGTIDALQQAFVDFANKVPFYGTVVACADDPGLQGVLARVRRRVVTYGLDHPQADVSGTGIELGGFGGRCLVQLGGDRAEALGVLELAVPGRHNLSNALAAVAVGHAVGLDFERTADALKAFRGVERRFQVYGESAGVLVIDDYAHHPTEIAAVLAAAKASLERRLIVAFQPHRYSRSQRLLDDFGPALAAANDIVLTEIYGAGEEAIAGVTLDAMAEAVSRGAGRRVRVACTLDALVDMLLDLARPGDAILTLGAGSIGTVPARLIEALATREARA